MALAPNRRCRRCDEVNRRLTIGSSPRWRSWRRLPPFVRSEAAGGEVPSTELWRMSINWPFTALGDEDGTDFYWWTAPQLFRCGDRVLLYEGGRGNRSAFIAVGRGVTDSVFRRVSRERRRGTL